MGWLAGWGQRIIITVSHANIDADLTHFPLMLELGTSVGTGDADVSRIFDELGSDANRTKIAVTKADGTTELYVEIEKWDDANEVAFLWVSKSDLVIAGASDTVLYLYYDADHAANTAYVADAGSRTEVWDAYFMAVLHMAAASGGTLVDSTSNNNDSSADTLDTATGKIGLGMNGDGSEYASLAHSASLNLGATTDNYTIEAWIKTSTVDTNMVICSKREKSSPYPYAWDLLARSTNYGGFQIYDGAAIPVVSTAASVTDGAWHYLAGVRDVSDDKIGIHMDGGARVEATDTTTATCAGDDDVEIGRIWTGSAYGLPFTGDIDEVRISSIDRTAAWIKANYYSMIDGLVAWGIGEYLKEITGAAAAAGTLPRSTGRHLTGTAATVGTVGRASAWLKTIATATAEAVGSLVRSTGRHFAGLASTVGTMRPLTVTRALAGTSSALGTARRATAKTVAAGTVSTVGTLTRGLVFMKTIATATAEAVGTVGRVIGKNLTGAAATVGTVGRAIARAITATAATVGAVPRAIAKIVASGTVSTVGSLIRGAVYVKAIATGIVSTVGTVVRQTGQVLSAAVEAVGLSIRPLTVGKVPDTTVGTVGTMRPLSITRAITGTVEAIGTARRGIAKTVATAVVSTVGTIWATAVNVIAGGAEVIASVSRRVYRNITATVPVLATITDFLYDIVYAMNQTFRRIYAKVRITYTDPYFSAGVATSADAVGDYTYTDQTVDNVTTEEYKWFSLHRNALDGTYHPLPGDQSISVGWWGTQLSDFATNVFVPPYPTLTITHAARIVETLLVVGDDQLNEYPVNFNIYLYSTGDVLERTENVTGNTLCTWTKSLSPAETGIVKQVLEITKWSRGDSVSKIAQFFTTLEQTYMSEDGDIVSLNMTEQREFSGTTIPQGNMASSEITVRLNNIEGIFDPGNTASPLYGLLLNNRAITAWLGVDLIPSGVRRWYPLGTFYSRDWSAPDSEIYAEVSGQDMLARLQSTTFSLSEVYEAKTLQELAIIVLTDAGLTSADWDIDPTFDTITVPYAWFDAVSHRECLRKIVAAAMGQCYCDRDGKLVLEVYQAPSLNPFAYTTANTFTFDHPLQWSQMVNYVEAQANPRVPSAEQNIVTDVEVITVPAGGTVTKLHFYSFSPCVDVQAPVITADPDVTVDSYTAYSWGISVTYANAGGGDETVTEVTVAGKMLEVQGSRVVVAQDATSIAQNGKQSLSEPISSEFWQDEERAQTVADAILETYRNPRRDIVMRARGNIAQLLGDRVEAVDSWYAATTAQYGIVGQDVSYDGGLEITVTAQQLGTRYDKELDVAIVGTIGTVARAQPEYKTLTAAAAIAGTVRRRTGKQIAGTVSTVGSAIRVVNPAILIEPVDPGAAVLYAYHATYSTAWNSATGTVGDVQEHIVGQAQGSGTYQIYRTPMLLSGNIPAGATITAAELWFYPTWLRTTAGAFSVVIQNGQPTYPSNPIVGGDYNKAHYTLDGGSIVSSSISLFTWNKITLNVTGLTWIQIGTPGVTKLMLRSSLDIAGTTPGSGLGSVVEFNSPYEGTNLPYMKVWYTV